MLVIKRLLVQAAIAVQLHNSSGQIVHTLVALSPNNIIWYWSVDNDAAAECVWYHTSHTLQTSLLTYGLHT